MVFCAPLVLVAAFLSYKTGNWSPLTATTLLLACASFFVAKLPGVIAVCSAGATAVFLSAGIGLYERHAFFNDPTPPDWVFSTRYGDEFDANEYRLLRMMCKRYGEVQWRIDFGEMARVRCGFAMPEAYRIEVPIEALRAAEEVDRLQGSPMYYISPGPAVGR